MFRKTLIFLKPLEFMAKKKVNTVRLHLSSAVYSDRQVLRVYCEENACLYFILRKLVNILIISEIFLNK